MRFRHFIPFIALLLVAIVAGMVWKRSVDRRPPVPPVVYAAPDVVVALPNNATMMAGKGTVTRALVDWLKGTTPGSKSFELGGEEFSGRTADPTPESLGRMTRLVAMLQAYPRIDLLVVGHASATRDADQDRTLAIARANRIVDLLRQARISRDRLQAEGRSSNDPLPGTDPASARNERISLTLERKPD